MDTILEWLGTYWPWLVTWWLLDRIWRQVDTVLRAVREVRDSEPKRAFAGRPGDPPTLHDLQFQIDHVRRAVSRVEAYTIWELKKEGLGVADNRELPAEVPPKVAEHELSHDAFMTGCKEAERDLARLRALHSERSAQRRERSEEQRERELAAGPPPLPPEET